MALNIPRTALVSPLFPAASAAHSFGSTMMDVAFAADEDPNIDFGADVPAHLPRQLS